MIANVANLAPVLFGASPEPFAGGGVATYAWAFGQGVLVDFTPCVYPLIPITVAVFGAKGVSRGKALFLASAYVLGMAVLYTTLGVVVAMSGSAFGAWLGNPWVVVPIALLMVALASSMFGAFDLQLPTSLQNRLNTVGGAGPVGAFLMGLVSGLISAPCTGPVLLSLLAYIAKSTADGGGVVYGGSLLFAYALGMGTIFFAVALGASLFRPGLWMEYIKSFFGIALLVMAYWFLRPLSADIRDFIVSPSWGLWLGAGMVVAGVLLGAIHLSFKAPTRERVRKTFSVGLATVGAVIVLNGVLYVPPMAWNHVASVDEFAASARIAETEGKPVLVDFGADWCKPCNKMEADVFHHATVEPVLAKRFHLIKIDVTDPSQDQQNMHNALVSGALPGVVAYGTDVKLSDHVETLRAGQPMPAPAAKFQALLAPEEFLDQIDEL